MSPLSLVFSLGLPARLAASALRFVGAVLPLAPLLVRAGFRGGVVVVRFRALWAASRFGGALSSLLAALRLSGRVSVVVVPRRFGRGSVVVRAC